jgi:hypothetical protein
MAFSGLLAKRFIQRNRTRYRNIEGFDNPNLGNDKITIREAPYIFTYAKGFVTKNKCNRLCKVKFKNINSIIAKLSSIYILITFSYYCKAFFCISKLVDTEPFRCC